MSDGWMDLGLIADVLDVLELPGYARGDTEHATRAILLISDLSRIYEGSLDHPFGPSINEKSPRTEPAPPEPADQGSVVLPVSEVRTVVAALDEASLYKRDRVATCADCADQSCGTCQWRLQAAQIYDRLAVQLVEKADATRAAAASNPRPASQPQPADREAGQ